MLLGGLGLLFVACQSSPQSLPEPGPSPVGPQPGESVAATKSVAVEEAAPAVEPGKITQIGIEDLYVRVGEGTVLLVDVRPKAIHGFGHIEGSISLPLRSFKKSFPERKAELDAAIEAGKLIVLYCGHSKCPDAGITAKKLSDMGYRVCIYKGGLQEWRRAGLD